MLILFGFVVTMGLMINNFYNLSRLYIKKYYNRFMHDEKVAAAPKYFKDALEVYKKPVVREMLKEKLRNHKSVIKARKKLL